MFEDVATADLLAEVAAHDFTSDPAHEAGAARIDAITALDRVIRTAQAAQFAQIASLHVERTARMGIGRGDPSLSVIGEVAMARNISPTASGNQLAVALGLAQLPQISALMRGGQIGESVARAVVKESANLGPDDLIVLDAELAPLLPGLTHVKAAYETARMVIRIDAEAARQRAAANRADCRVSMFPDRDGVAILQARGPAEQILAAHNALDAWAQRQRKAGDARTTGQIMVQTLVERVTGLAHADGVSVEVGLVMDARTAIAGGDEPVDLAGYGPISPDVADDIIASARSTFIRRLLTDPVDGTLIARDPRRRRFDGPLGGHIHARDQRCRQPGCECRIREIDHSKPYADGGLTTADNGQGLCRRSHTIRHQPGWSVHTQGKATIWRTPTGHQYRSEPPPLLGHLRQ